MSQSCTAFFNDDPQPLITLLEEFLRSRPVRSIKDSSEQVLQGIIEVFWSKKTCIMEVCLVVDATRSYGEGKHGFVDIFLPSVAESSAIIIELKNIMLTNLWKAQTKKPYIDAASTKLETLWKSLAKEDEEKLLQRKFRFYDKSATTWKMSTVQSAVDSAIDQVRNYMNVIEQGAGGLCVAGLVDGRVRCDVGNDSLEAHEVVCIGGTRVLTTQPGRVKTKYSFRPNTW